MRRRSDHLQYEAAFNWPLCDLGISRNGQPLRLPPDLADAVMQHQVRNHAQLAAWPWFDYYDPTDWVDGGAAAYESMLGNVRWIPQDAGIDISRCGDLEMLIVPPYVLMVQDGSLVGVVGGDGRFDQIPADWEYLRP
ncbi:MAG: hypothetical protein H0W78_13530 [Planctomycetes bacterium]|jgi:hypothetical protein|nr:hypothetical protein [Planctomycetota bacterium]